MVTPGDTDRQGACISSHFHIEGGITDHHGFLGLCPGFRHAAFDSFSLDLPSAEAVRRVVGLPLIEAIALLFPAGEADIHQKLRKGYRKAYLAARESGQINDPLFPGLHDAMDAV